MTDTCEIKRNMGMDFLRIQRFGPRESLQNHNSSNILIICRIGILNKGDILRSEKTSQVSNAKNLITRLKLIC